VRRPVVVTTAALLALTLTACGDEAAESALDSRAEWSGVTLPAAAQLSGERVSFAAALGTTADQPALVAGTGAEPGEPGHARAWTDNGDDGWRWKELPLPENREHGVSLTLADGSTTWIAGTTWEAGERMTPSSSGPGTGRPGRPSS
jgi:hypothetical protein